MTHQLREAAKCTETRLAGKGKNCIVAHSFSDFFEAMMDFEVRCWVPECSDRGSWAGNNGPRLDFRDLGWPT